MSSESNCSMCGRRLRLDEQVVEEQTGRVLCAKCDRDMEAAEDLLADILRRKQTQ